MKIRFASALLALALPLCAQEPAAAAAEVTFYKAFYLEKGQRDFAGAMTLYQQFLEQAPEHKFAAEAAKQQFALLDKTGKTKERDAFKAKYEKLLGNIASAPPAAGGAAGGDGARGERGERGERGAGGGAAGGRMDPAARLAELEKQLEKAKADGNAEEQKRLEQQIERMKQGGGRGQGGQGGQGGPGGGMRGGLMGALRGTKKIAEMNDEEMTALKGNIEQAGGAIDMMRERSPELADKLEKGVAELKKALDAGNKEDAQKAMDALREAMPQRRRGGGGGEGGAGGGGGGGGGGV
jgi:tetratricopeptide (TPR) repeat protein